jgi:hypothetical protein
VSAQAQATLHSAVERLIGPVDRIHAVRREPIAYDVFLAGRSVARVTGRAGLDGRTVAWSLIEKRTDGPDSASAYLVDNAAREGRAYGSGLLADLAQGLRAPMLLAMDGGRGGPLTLWLEDVAPHGLVPRTRDDVCVAARHLGRMAGRWIGRVPDHPWLFRGWIERHSQPQAVEAGLAVLADARHDLALAERIAGRLDEAMNLVRGQAEIGAILRTIPTTLCHHDAVAANVFVRPGETVLIDWESVGPGAVGADLASLLFSSPRRGDFPSAWLQELMPEAQAAYRDGLAEAGARIGEHEVALGLHASIALRWTLVRDVTRAIRAGATVFRGSAPQETPELALAELLALVPVLLDSAAQARRLNRAASRRR